MIKRVENILNQIDNQITSTKNKIFLFLKILIIIIITLILYFGLILGISYLISKFPIIIGILLLLGFAYYITNLIYEDD